jgi:hypothetical protein
VSAPSITPEQLAAWRALRAAATQGKWSVYVEPCADVDEAARELRQLVLGTESFAGALHMLTTKRSEAHYVAPAVAGCGAESPANAAFIATAANNWDALLDAAVELVELRREVADLRALINTPHTNNFLEAVRLEAVHQRERWGSEHDAGKTQADWFWLLGYLGQKALYAALAGDTEKALHHTISSAAMLLNWHAALSGADTRMRPGIDAKEALSHE